MLFTLPGPTDSADRRNPLGAARAASTLRPTGDSLFFFFFFDKQK
jgi:hypothetical protein